MRSFSLSALAAAFLCGTVSLAETSVMKKLPTDRTNHFYVSNRPPLLPSPLCKLPIGSIKPRGWLLHILKLEADGMTGHLPELSHWCRKEGSAWASPEGKGRDPWEELPYWLKGYGDLGYVLGDKRIIEETFWWIEAVLRSQKSDGWFGPRSNKTRLKGRPDCWPNMIMLNVLQSFYEYTRDERVLGFMSRYFRWQLSVPEKDFLVPFWQHMRAGDNLESVYWLYNRTGAKELLDLAEKIHRSTADWTSGIASWHGVNIAQCFREPGVYFMQSKDPRFLKAAERNYETVMGIYGQVPGGMFGADENCRKGYTDPRQAAETCSMVEFMHSFEMLFKITGDPVWADRCEEVAFNSFPASQTPDLCGLHYLTAPNMVQLDRGNKSPGLQNRGCMLAYNPWSYRCCQHNVSHGWPYFAEELWHATADDGLCASVYAPSSVTALVAGGKKVSIVEETEYPFEERITFTLSASGTVRFPLYLRIPRWCRKASVSVNGKKESVAPPPLSFVRIERGWRKGDRVELVLPADIAITVWKKNKNAVSISRGPLTFSLKIGEKWVRYGGTEKWPAYEVFPTTPWNYGLVLSGADPTSDFEIVKKRGRPWDIQPFTPEAAPIELRVKARRIPQWGLDELGLVGTLGESPAFSDRPEERITLIPMGCARLRISAFPTVTDGPEGHRWTSGD